MLAPLLPAAAGALPGLLDAGMEQSGSGQGSDGQLQANLSLLAAFLLTVSLQYQC